MSACEYIVDPDGRARLEPDLVYVQVEDVKQSAWGNPAQQSGAVLTEIGTGA